MLRVRVCSMVQLLNYLTDCHGIYYERYDTGGHPQCQYSNPLQPVITTWRTRELVRYNRTRATDY
jgi:hypothetical protein